MKVGFISGLLYSTEIVLAEYEEQGPAHSLKSIKHPEILKGWTQYFGINSIAKCVPFTLLANVCFAKFLLSQGIYHFTYHPTFN